MKKVSISNKAKFLTTLAICGTFTGAIIKGNIDNNLSVDKSEYYYSTDIDSTLSGDELLEMFQEIYSNNLTLQKYWSDIYPELCEVILENGKYLDQEQLLENLQTLSFCDEEKFDNSRVFGYFDSRKNLISFSENLKYRPLEEQNEIKFHEACHFLFLGGFSSSFLSNKGYFLDEGNATAFSQEYDEYVGMVSYSKAATYVRVICELIGSDKYMDAAGSRSISKLVDYLSELSSEASAKKLIKYIDSACNVNVPVHVVSDESAWEIIDRMYENKHGVFIKDSDDIVMKIYANSLNETFISLPGARGYSSAKLHKNYFNPDDEVYYDLIDFDKNYGRIYLNEDNSIKYGSFLADGFYSEDGSIVDKNDVPMSSEVVSIDGDSNKFLKK